jgi:2-succinyl-5-enolpyruvyl-6-hydroxy-3-cyclohexene-1-carboxylate synthase
MSEGQVVSAVLKYLRSQTQLVLGNAVTAKDIKDFLSAHGVVP